MSRRRKRREIDRTIRSDSDEMKRVQERIELLERKAGIIGKPNQKHSEFEMQDALNRLQRMERELRAFNRREGTA